jgi:hypothetical protein
MAAWSRRRRSLSGGFDGVHGSSESHSDNVVDWQLFGTNLKDLNRHAVPGQKSMVSIKLEEKTLSPTRRLQHETDRDSSVVKTNARNTCGPR